MKLWTWQGRCFDLHGGIVDPRKGEYAQIYSEYMPSVCEIAEHLKTDQFIWASSRYHPFPRRVGYQLDVPEDSILAVIDGFLWNLRFGNGRIPPPSELKAQWESEAGVKHPYNGWDRRKHGDAKVRAWQERSLPDDWWQKVIRGGPSSEDPQYILPFPIPPEWVIEKDL